MRLAEEGRIALELDGFDHPAAVPSHGISFWEQLVVSLALMPNHASYC